MRLPGPTLAWRQPLCGCAGLTSQADSGGWGGTHLCLTSSAGESPVARADSLHLGEPGPWAVLISKTGAPPFLWEG